MFALFYDFVLIITYFVLIEFNSKRQGVAGFVDIGFFLNIMFTPTSRERDRDRSLLHMYWEDPVENATHVHVTHII